MCSYISSARIITFGCRASTSARARSSLRVYTEPVGLLGEQSMMSEVFSVIAPSSCSGVILKSWSCDAKISTGVPSASFTISM